MQPLWIKISELTGMNWIKAKKDYVQVKIKLCNLSFVFKRFI